MHKFVLALVVMTAVSSCETTERHTTVVVPAGSTVVVPEGSKVVTPDR
jgi:hypothetical protein